jgi:ATP-dependent RNA helicase DDX49/DBP8
LKEDGRTRKDVFACSRTGSGKTLAYVLPILEILVKDPRPYFALILAPTRELAYQINDMIKILTGSRGSSSFVIKSLLVIGGGNYGDGVNTDEARGLWFGKPNIVVATPGRFLDQLENRNQIDLCGGLKTLSFDMLVMDEADQLISTNFAQQIKSILDWLDANDIKHLGGMTVSRQKKRQTLVFSATLTDALEELQKVVTRRDPSNQPVVINLLPTMDKIMKNLKTNPDLDQRYVLCPENAKLVYLMEILLDLSFRQTIIFCYSKDEARLIHRVLLNLGFSGEDFKLNPVLLNSKMKQSLRFAALDMFKALKSRILVTTDLANRGLDIPQVDLVINYNVPRLPITYVHRVGRTCRDPDFEEDVEAKPLKDEESSTSKTESTSKKKKYTGKSVTMVTQYDIHLIQAIEEFIGLKLEKEEGIDEDNVVSIMKQVGIAVKEAELAIEFEDEERNSKRPRKGHKTVVTQETNDSSKHGKKKMKKSPKKDTEG